MKRRPITALPLLVLACSAANPGDACPSVDTADLDCPVQIEAFEISTCEPTPDGPATPPELHAAVMASTLHVDVGGVLFRDDNEVCGFAERDADEVRILLQPCVLVPEGGTSKGDCWYASLAFDVDGVELRGAKRVTVLHRVDRPPEFPPFTPEALGSVVLE